MWYCRRAGCLSRPPDSVPRIRTGRSSANGRRQKVPRGEQNADAVAQLNVVPLVGCLEVSYLGRVGVWYRVPKHVPHADDADVGRVMGHKLATRGPFERASL